MCNLLCISLRYCFPGENEPVSLQSSLTFRLKPNQLKNSSQTPSQCTRRQDDGPAPQTAYSKVRACPREAVVEEAFVDGTVAVDKAGEEDDIRSITCSWAIVLLC